MAMSSQKHAEACRRANIAALDFFQAQQSGDKYRENIAFADFKDAFNEANLAFAELAAGLGGAGTQNG